MTALTLRDIVRVETLQEIQNRFADATGLAVVITDEEGTPVTQASNFTQFCTFIRSSEAGLKRCMLSDERVGIMAARQGKPVIHRCHSGLVDLAAPVILNDQYLGAVLCGQVLMEDFDREQLHSIRARTKRLPVDQAVLDEYFQQIDFTTKKRIEAAAEMLYLVANYIIKMAATQLAQEELFEKKQKLMEELEVRTRLERSLKEAQLRILQAQINPHFLFNTLNTISCLAYREGASETQMMTYSLAKMLRYSLRTIDQLVSFRDEWEHAKHYLTIQESRFRGRIHYSEHLHIDPEAVKLPILCLQPIIENAIVHGLETQQGAIRIRVSAYYEDDRVAIEISDNGVGMSEQVRQEILDGVHTNKSSRTTGIGLQNVHKRIQYYFGEDMGITAIESVIGKGTMVRLTIPK
ncbi:sensor histidine kinase [Brevibacillus sp. TJ4]|uniref:sensor histidine kinase n=1 Tax=Brevibacillus sp. TJ4 TaxID=3234853 RepID=UPI0037CF4DC1